MSNIPGLQICPVEDGDGKVISVPSFTDTVHIPESHRYGNCRRISDFKIVNKISEGFFGTYIVQDKRTGEIFTLKKFKMPSFSQTGVPKSVLREFNILNSFNYVNIIKSHGAVVGSKLELNYLLMDYCRFSLKDLINEKFPIFDISVVKCIMLQLFSGLDYIHSAMVIHRDINSENIVFDDGGILKITGFEYSRFFNLGAISPVKSELRYRAPELLLNSKTYDMKVDMWSAGCLFAELVTRKPLFTGDSELEILKKIFQLLGTPNEYMWPGFNELLTHFNNGKYKIENSKPYNDLKMRISEVSFTCYDVIQKLLIYFPKARLNAKECIGSTYLIQDPKACSTLQLASILKNVKKPAKTPVRPMETSN